MPEQDPRSAQTSITPTNFPFPWRQRSFCGSSQPAQGIMKGGGFSRETLCDLWAGSKEQLLSSKMQPATSQMLLQYLHPSLGRNSGFHLSETTTSPCPLHTTLEFKSLLWRLKILPLPQQEALPSPILWGQAAWEPLLAAGSSFPLPMSKGRTQLKSTVCIHVQKSYSTNVLLIKHFVNTLFCTLAELLFLFTMNCFLGRVISHLLSFAVETHYALRSRCSWFLSTLPLGMDEDWDDATDIVHHSPKWLEFF